MRKIKLDRLCLLAGLFLIGGCNPPPPGGGSSTVYVSVADVAALTLAKKKSDSCDVKNFQAELLLLRGVDAELSTLLYSDKQPNSKASFVALSAPKAMPPGRCCPCPLGYGCQCLVASRAFVSIASWDADMTLVPQGDSTSGRAFAEEPVDGTTFVTHSFPTAHEAGTYTLKVSGKFGDNTTHNFEMLVKLDENGNFTTAE